MKIPKLGGVGGGGSAAWEFFPHNPVFFSDNVPYADDDGDLYIMVRCLSVCLSVTKRHHFYSKDFVVSPVYSFIPYSKELVVSMFLDTFVFKGFGRFSCL